MRWPAAALLALALSGCLSGGEPVHDGPTGQIDGAVLNHVLIPYGNASVHLDTGQTTQTTQLGGFSFFDVPIGFHTVEVEVAGAGLDREVVAVNEDSIARVILQLFPAEEPSPHVTSLSDSQIVQVAMPGEHCEECEWSAALRETRPEAVELKVAWDGRHPLLTASRTDLIVELRDQDGNTLIGPLGRHQVEQEEGLHVLCAAIDGRALPATAGSLQVHFRFDPENQAPHPDFKMESFLRLHYQEVGGLWC